MLTLTLNPGFVPIIVGLLMLAAPRMARGPMMAGAALLALWLLLDREFGAATAMAQMGLPVVLLSLDALNRIFGIGMLIVLIALAIYTNARRNRYEDAAILMLAGGSVSTLFVGDPISFVAAASLSGLAAAWTVFAAPQEHGNRAGVRLLIWHGLEGLLFLVGVALHLTANAGNSAWGQLNAGSFGGACIFAALMIRVGAPMASLLHPAHPLMQSVTDLVLEAHRNKLKQGAVLVDPADMGLTPKVMFIIDHSVKEGGDPTRVVSRRMQFVEIDPKGNAINAGWAALGVDEWEAAFTWFARGAVGVQAVAIPAAIGEAACGAGAALVALDHPSAPELLSLGEWLVRSDGQELPPTLADAVAKAVASVGTTPPPEDWTPDLAMARVVQLVREAAPVVSAITPAVSATTR